MEEIEFLFVFNILRHSSRRASKRLKRKKCSTGERVEYKGSLFDLNSPVCCRGLLFLRFQDQSPRLRLKEGVERPLLITRLDIFLEKNVLIHPKKESPKLKNSSDLRRKFQFKESKTFSKNYLLHLYLGSLAFL